MKNFLRVLFCGRRSGFKVVRVFSYAEQIEIEREKFRAR